MSVVDLKSISGITSITTPASDNQLTLHTNNTTERLRIDSNGNIGAGIAPSSGARLWIATNDNPLVSTRYNAGADGAVLFLEHSRSNTIGTKVVLNDNDEIGAVQFRAYASDNSTIKNAAQIKAEVNGTTSANGVPTDLIFGTGTTSANAVERLRIESDGSVGIGTDDASWGLSGAGGLVVGDGSGAQAITIFCSGNADLSFGDSKSGTARYAGLIRYNHTDDYMAFRTATQERLRIASDGKVGISEDDPQALLHLNAGASSAIMFGNTTHGYKIRANVSSSNDYGLLIEDEDGVDLYRVVSSTGTSNTNTHTFFGTGGEEIVRFNSSSTELIRISGPVDSSTQQEFGIGIAVNDAHTHPAAKITLKEYDASDSRGDLLFYTRGANSDSAPTERFRINSDGRLLVGHNSARVISTTVNAHLQLEGTTYHQSAISVTRNTNDGYGSYFTLGKSRGTSVGSNVVLQNNDIIGELRFAASDGTDMACVTALIRSIVNGTPGSDDTPGALIFATTPDGAATTTERLRITSGGSVNLGTGELTQTARKLNVYGGAIRATQTSNGNTVEVFGHTATGQSYGLLCSAGTNSADQNALFRNASGTTILKIRGDGNIGINENSPGAKLHISHTNEKGLFLEDSSNSNASPYIQVLGKRSDGNTHQNFTGQIFLSSLRTDQKVASGKQLGTVLFGGNHTDGTQGNILYAASITGVADDNFDSATDMPTALVFKTGTTGRAPLAANVSSGDERLRIASDGHISMSDDGSSYGTKLTIRPPNRTTAFAAATGSSWHDVVIKQSGSATNNAVGLAFEVSTSGYHHNAGTGIAAVKNGTNADYGCHLAFITRGQSIQSSEKMRIHDSGGVSVSSTAKYEGINFYVGGTLSRLGNFFIGRVPGTSNNSTGVVLIGRVGLNFGMHFSGQFTTNSYTGTGTRILDITTTYNDTSAPYSAGAQGEMHSSGNVSRVNIKVCIGTVDSSVTESGSDEVWLCIRKNGGGTGTCNINAFIQTNAYSHGGIREVAGSAFTQTQSIADFDS